MGLIEGIRGQLRTVVSWEDTPPDVLFQRWTDDGDEIKNASRLIVGPGQGCVFVYEGQVRAVLTHECMIDLHTANIPFWTTISRAMQAFRSEHKVGLYFFKTTKLLNQKWGTTAPIKYLDPFYRIPVELKAYGNYSAALTDPKEFFVTVVGGAPSFLVKDLREVMAQRLVQPLTDYLAEAKHSYVDIDAHRNEAAEKIGERLAPEFEKLGFTLTDFRIEGVDFDDGTKQRIGRIADVTAEVQAAEAAGLDYTRVQQLEAMREAARNEGGAAGIGVGVGAGMGLGQIIAGAAPAPSASAKTEDPAAKLKQLKGLFDAQLISEVEFGAKKKQILDSL